MSITFAGNNASYNTPDELFQDVSSNLMALECLCKFVFTLTAETEEVAEAIVPTETVTTTTVTVEPVVDPSTVGE